MLGDIHVDIFIKGLGAKSPEFLPTIASMYALGYPVSAHELAHSLLLESVECPALYEIDCDRQSKNEELAHLVPKVIAELGQEIPNQKWARIKIAKELAIIADKEGEDLAKFAIDQYMSWHDLHQSGVSALDFMYDALNIDHWPPEYSWETDAADRVRIDVRRLIDWSIEELLLLDGQDQRQPPPL